MARLSTKQKPRRSGAPLPLLVPYLLALLVPPAIHAAQHERAGRAGVPVHPGGDRFLVAAELGGLAFPAAGLEMVIYTKGPYY